MTEVDMTIYDVPDHYGYGINKNGELFSKRTRGNLDKISPKWKNLKVSMKSCGYLATVFRRNTKRITVYVHRLTALAFIPNMENKPLVCHKNGKATDNRVENLYWGTQKENMADRKLHGTDGLSPKGEKHYHAKLKNKEVEEIRRLLVNGAMSQRQIAEIYHVSQSTIYHIKSNKIWKI